MTMKLGHCSWRSFLVSFLLSQVLENRGSVLASDDDVRVVYFSLPSANNRTVLKCGPALFGVDLRGRNPIESTVAMVEPSKGCTDISNSQAVLGKIALVNRGDCLFIEKARHIQRTGALAAIVIDNNPGLSAERTPVFVMHHGYKDDDIIIPMVFLYFEEAALLLQAYRQYPDLVVGVADVVPASVPTTIEPVPETTEEEVPTTIEPVPETTEEEVTETEESVTETDDDVGQTLSTSALKKEESVQKSEDDAGGETQLSSGYIALIVICVLILIGIAVSTISFYYFCHSTEKTGNIKFSELKE